MRKSSPTTQRNQNESSDSDRYCLGNLDLLNLRLTFSSDDKHSKREPSSKRSGEKGAGDDSNINQTSKSKHHHHPLEKSNCLPLVPNLSRAPKGYGDRPLSVSSEDLVLLYSKVKEPGVVTTGPINEKDFLFPSKKKTRTQVIDVISNDRMTRQNSVKQEPFPFKLTPSGNLKVNTKQVVYSTNKLSVVVADPINTTVNYHTDSYHSIHMAQEQGEPRTSAMDTIMSQAGFSSLGSLIGNTPVRSAVKESTEYESKATHQILDPELNLIRLGYTGTEAIPWEKVILPEKKNLYLELYSRITNYTNADCRVYIDNEEFNCHLIVLQCYSEMFESYIAAKKVELPSDKCSASAFAFIYEWMITGEPSYRELTRDNVLDIFNSAKFLKIKDLVEQCWAFIDNHEVFSEDTAFLLYMDAKSKGLDEVRELMLPRIQWFFLMLVSSQDWLELDLEDIKALLKSNYIRVNCEMEIFMSAVRWLKHDWNERDQYKYEILDCIRFGNIAPWQLVDIKRNPENPDFMELAKDPKICKMIDDGLAYTKCWDTEQTDNELQQEYYLQDGFRIHNINKNIEFLRDFFGD